MLSGLLVMIWTATVFAQNGCNSNRTAETHSNLVLSSPNYPQDYDNNMDCLWRIQTNPFSGPDYIIKVTFQDFELEDPHSLFSCQYDSLKFYDGPLPLESTLLGSYCGTVRPDVIYSQGKYLYVKFHSDSTTTYKGFELYYTAVKREEALGICRPPYLDSVVSSLSGSSGTFFSPDFPVPYPANATCTWTITVPEGKGVMLTFEDFALRKHSVTSDCHDDWRDFVEIRDSLSSTGKQLGRFNCDLNAPDLPLKVYSTGRYMFVKFHSSFSTSFRREGDKGFKAKFEAANQPSLRCNFNRTAETHYLVLSSPNYPQNYDNKMDCLWRIQTNPFSTGPDYIIKVTFQDFELENPHNLYFCQYDSLKFYDGTLPQESTVLGSYCGTVRPDVIYSRGKYLYVKFQSDSTTTYKGFELYYTAVKKEEALGICRPPYLDSVVSSLNGSSGTFFSPGYPVPYPASATCTWTITVPEGKRVMLTFEDFALRKHSVTSDCHGDWKDFVEIRDSLSSTGKQLGRFNCDLNAPDLPPKVYSNGRYMFVKFHSSFGTPFRREGDKGFKAKFEAVNQPSTHVDSSGLCSPGNRNKILRLTGSSGTLKVPPKYPEGLRCTWLINVPEGNDVKLSFTKFDLNCHGGTCGDNVEILDGQYTSSERLEKYCAYADPSPKGVASNGRYMMVIFRADFRSNFGGSNQREGIEANFRAVKESNSTLMGIGVTVGAVILIIIIGLCCVCHAKKKRRLNRETRAARIPMTTTTTTASASHTIHPPPSAPEAPVANPYPTPEVGSAPVPTEPPPPYYPYPLESPPPYPGLEGGLQYPPPGESYPWSQSTAPTQPGAPPTYL